MKYEGYEKLHIKGDLGDIDFSNKKYQKYLVITSIKNNNNLKFQKY